MVGFSASFDGELAVGFRIRFCGENSAVGFRQRSLAAAFRRLDFGIGLYAAGFERRTFGGELSVVAFCLRAFDDEFSAADSSGGFRWLDLVKAYFFWGGERLTLNCGLLLAGLWSRTFGAGLLLAGFRPLTFGGGF